MLPLSRRTLEKELEAVTNSLDFTNSKGGNGYTKLPNGIILQWGRVTGAGTITATFPIAFPNDCINITATIAYYANSCQPAPIASKSKTSAGIYINQPYYQGAFWFAVGY